MAFRDSASNRRGRRTQEIEIEVSVLTPLVSVPGPDAVSRARGSFCARRALGRVPPQVATEQAGTGRAPRQSRAQGGLPENAWHGKDAKILTFRADVFDESSLK